jgi:hypothetical protein
MDMFMPPSRTAKVDGISAAALEKLATPSEEEWLMCGATGPYPNGILHQV